eukprot:TRINITY_DN403_c0_g1_i8.p1 TRINITY_DN403_c0_g1~~TRINITY_DN403_c0_g1_i8.p1  ORF type:complete len:267 (-),score=60.50 TRINITY_DN403_c0_g1_i8:25-825(-)
MHFLMPASSEHLRAARKRERLQQIEDKIEKLQKISKRSSSKEEVIKCLTLEVEPRLKKNICTRVKHTVKCFPRDTYSHLLYEAGDWFKVGTYTHTAKNGTKKWYPVFQHFFTNPNHVSVFDPNIFARDRIIPELRGTRQGIGRVCRVNPPVEVVKKKSEPKKEEKSPREEVEELLARREKELEELRSRNGSLKQEEALMEVIEKIQLALERHAKIHSNKGQHRPQKIIPITLCYNWKTRALQIKFDYEVYVETDASGKKEKILVYV